MTPKISLAKQYIKCRYIVTYDGKWRHSKCDTKIFTLSFPLSLYVDHFVTIFVCFTFSILFPFFRFDVHPCRFALRSEWLLDWNKRVTPNWRQSELLNSASHIRYKFCKLQKSVCVVLVQQKYEMERPKLYLREKVCRSNIKGTNFLLNSYWYADTESGHANFPSSPKELSPPEKATSCPVIQGIPSI
jgi:hypothetical protein